MESNQFQVKTKKMPYGALSLEQKADFIAHCLDFGWADYFDRCKKLEDGRYEYYSAQTEETTISTAEELVTNAEEYGKDEIIAMWEDYDA